MEPQPRGPDWMPITPKTGSLFHADSQTVEAPDEKSAIAEAMKTFNITPARRFKLVVTKTEAAKRD